MALELAMAAEQAAPAARQCDCPPSYCTFTRGRVYHYLIVWEEARRHDEPFADVLRSESRVSQDVDPWIRGGRIDPDMGRLIGVALEYARDRFGIALVPHNAERISQALCPARWHEGQED